MLNTDVAILPDTGKVVCAAARLAAIVFKFAVAPIQSVKFQYSDDSRCSWYQNDVRGYGRAAGHALVLEQRVLLTDKPLSNLDSRLRRRMRDDIRDIQN